MARSAHNDVLDALLTEIATANRIAVCDTEPTTRAQANTTYMLAATAITAGDGGGDFTIGQGDVNGRKVAVAAQSNVAISNTGTAAHIALMDATDLLFVTTVTAQLLTSGGTVTIPTFDVEAADPTAPA